MPSLSLKIVLDEGAVTRKVKFNTNMTVKQALAVVKDKVIVPDKGKEYALFLRSADDDLTGVWLEDDRTLDYYMLRDGDSLDYICRVRTLRVKLLDDTVKTLQVDEAKTVGELMMSICNRIGITNYDEYGLCHDEEEETEEPKEVKEGTGTLTLKRKQAKQERDAALEQLSKKLKTDDNVEWLDLHRSLREQGIDPKETLLLKRRLYYSDRNVDSRDPVQLHLLYVQTRDTILNGTHPVTEQQAIQFAGIQCQVQLGDYQEKKHKTGFIEKLEEYLPAQYLNAWNVEKKIAKEFAQHQGLSELEAKFLYIKTARALPTYGVTFFLVKEKQKDKKKLVPRLLGINSHAILRLDEVTKEILQEWPLTHVKTYHAGKSQTFTLNFGDYSDKEYSVKTQDCHRIRDILEAYIDIIRRRMLAKPSRDPGESMAICHDNIQQGTSHLIQHVSNSPSKMVTETFVGPNKLITSEHGSQPQSGTMITTVQQLVVTDHLQNQQMALKGEMPLRGDMSKDCIKKLNRMNSNSVKIVGLLTDPTENDYEEIQNIVRAMKEDFPDIDKGVKETADKQAIEDAKKMLLDELHDLNNFMKKLEAATAPGNIGREGAKDAAENIADLTTQIYFSLDPKTRRRSELIRRSRNKMKAGEKSEQSMRRASFLAAANSAQHALDSAVETLYEDYTGPKPDAAERMKLEKALEDKMGKLNAAIALYLTAHSDPENIDYASAINSMNAINELMPEIAKDTQILASTLAPSSREQLLDDMQELCNATRAVCGTTSAEDHAKMQEATNQYAGIAGKLISTFARGTNADKEHEIIELAKDVGAKTSLLLVSTNELTCQAASEPAAADVDTAGVRVAGAATDLIACAQLTAPAIHEPHCQSALTAACEGISSSVHQLETAWRPLLEDQTRRPMNDQLHSRVVDVGKALERLKDAYANLEGTGVDDDDSSLPAQERKRLKFITTMNGAKGRLRGVEDLWNQQSATGAPSNEQKAEAQRRMEQSMAQLNAAIAALAAATADRENPDYATAELAIATISELMPQIVKDAEIASSDKDEATRNAMQNNIRALCEATRKICEGDGYKHVDGEEAATFAAASGKLLFLISPGADKGRQKFIMEEAAIAQEHAAQLVAGAHRLQNQVPEHTAAELGSRAARTADAANALGAVAQVTAPSISSPRCQDALSSAASQLLGSADSLTSACQLQAHEQPELQAQCAVLTDTHQQLADSLHRLTDACNVGQGGHSMKEPSAQQERKRLQFVKGTAAAKQRLDAAAQQLNKPMSCHMMEEGHAAALGQKLNDRLAQLNAAVAALAAATSDREHPDYEAAEKAVNSISQIMPHLIQDSQMLCGTKSDAEQAAMLQELRALCEATQELCDNAGQAQGVGDAIAKYTDASTKLVYCATPRADNEMENEILGLTTDACGKASELLSQVQQLTERVADAGAAAELDRCGASAADAAQALLTVAQATASTMDSPCCKDQLISAAQKLRGCADELTASCEPHTAQLPDARRQLGASHRQLADSLDKLVQACKKIPEASQSSVSQPQREKQRLKFMNSLTGARNRLYDSEQQLKQPLPKHQLTPEQAAALEQRLSQRLAQLNAAVAALAAAKDDPKNPDWIAAEQAVKEISELMPLIVQDSRQLSSTKDGAGQAAMLEELKALSHASRSLCENSETDPTISTKDFHKAASKLKFIVSPTSDKTKEKQVVELGKAACKQAERLALNAQTACPAQAPLASRLQEAAGSLDSVVQATSPSPSDPRCGAAVKSSADNVRHCAEQLTSSCEPPLMMRPEAWQQLLSCQRQLTNDLDKLVQAYQPEVSGPIGTGSGHQEQQRLKFINSASGAKGRLNAVDKMLKEPLVCQLMKEDDGAALQRRLGARVAQLNAAVAALTAATADREHPDYAAADQAIQQIAQLMPQVVQESRTLCGTKSDAEQAAMLQELRALCEATQELCDNAGQAQGVSDAAAKFSAASGKLVYVVSPKTQDAHEKQVLALAATSCGKASELLSQVQQLTERVADAGAAAELDRCGASAADAAQALLTVAQTTAPTINDPQCQKQLISAAQKLRGCADELTASCEPHTAQLPDARRQLGASHRQLADSLDKLIQTCRSVPRGTLGGVSSEQQEQQRLKFINSASGAKGRLNAVDKMLKEPLVCQLMKEDDGAALQRRLGARVAQLNAAVAALTAATADREHPDYAAADQAIQQIAQLMPQVVQESRTLCGTKSDAEQAAMLQELRALCEATQELCDNAGQAQGVSDAAAKFSAASGKLVYVVSPKTQDAHEKQVLALAATSCGKASELLSQVQQLTERVADAGAAAELDRCGASAADAAQALLTVAQTTAPTIEDPQCQKQLISAAQKLRGCADELTASCEPHTAQLPDARRQLGTSHRQLADSLDKLIQTCRSVPRGTLGGVSSEQQEQQRLKFINSASGAKGRLNAVDKMLKEPLVCQLMKEDDGAALQRRLGARVAQLNAAVAALTAATADREHPDYAAADQAIQQIAQLMPQVVQESRTLCGTKSDAEQAAMLQELRALCEATQELCDNAGQAQGVSDAAVKFSAASGKLVYVVSPKTQDAHEKQVLALAATSCGKASELLSQVQQLTERVADAGAAAELDRCGASAADAAQALLTVAQTTAPTINDPQCQKQLISAAQKLRGCADELTASCEPHTAQLPDARRQLGASHRQLADSLDKLMQTCRSVPHGGVSSEQQEQQRLKFINSASGAKGRLNAVDKMLKEPLVCQLMKEDDGAALQRRLGARVAQLNAAVAALTAATADREHPDYAAADQAIQQIAQLMPQVVQESRTLCGTKSDAEQAAMLQELRALCEATQELCDNAGQAQGVSDAAAKFSAASGKLVYVVSPKTQDAHEKQVLALAATSCGKASELLSQVQQLTERVADAGAAAELDRCGASAADAAQALLTVAQTTAPTISDPQCQKQVISSAQKLRRCADGLIATCEPHTAQLPDTRRQLGSSHRQLDESLDKLVQVCHSASGADVVLSPQQEQQRLKFVNSMSGAKSRLDTAEQQMKKPVIVKPLQQADTAVLQQQLSRRLAQLNAALAALAAATQDGKNPDYPAAERAVTTVIELMPEIVQDSHKICGTKEPAEQAAMMEELRELCEASRTICDSAGHPIKLNEASAKLADASSKLLYIVSPEGKRPGDATRGPKPAVQPRKPAVPARDSKHTVAKAVRSGQAPEAQSFLDAMRAEESGGLVKTSKTAEEEKLARKEFSHMIENAERGLKSAEEGLQTLYKTKNATTAGQSLPALEVVRREQHMEDTLAKAGIEVAALVSANYADKLDYKAAMKPTLSLTESVRSVVNDGSAICSSMPDDARKKFLEDMIGLCQSTKILCDTAKSDKEKLNDAAIVFGDQSVKLLRVVSCNVDPALEKEAISRAKAIGDAASRLALEATSLASSTSETNNPGTADSQVRDICAAGTSCVDSAGKLVYTAKLIAPTIHHETCQDALVSSADNLSSSLTTFSNTLAPLASTQHPNVQKLLGEAGHLEKLVEKLRKDVRAGKFGKRREVDPVVDLDFPLRNLTEKIIENAKNMVRDDTMDAQTKKQYKDYCGKLEEALRALDLANARYQRAPHDHNKRDEFEMNIDELQMTVLQARPARAGQEQNNIVDFRDFLQDLVNEAGTLEKTVRKNEGPIGKRTSEDIKMLCSKISEDASRLLNPSDNFGDGVTVMNTVDDILDIDLFGQECDTLVKEINNSIQGVQDQKTRQELLAKSLPMLESCYLLRFATNSHIMATQSSAYNEIIQNLDEFKSTTMSTLAKEAAKKSTKQTKSYSSALGSQCCQARASSRLVAAGQRAARGDPHDLVRAVTHYAVSSAARPPVVTMEQAYEVPKRAQMMTMSDQVEDVPLELEKHVEKENRYFATMSRIVDTTHGITSAHKVCAPSIYIGVYPQNNKANKHLKELSELDYKLYPKQVSTQVLNSDDIDRLLLCPRETVEGTPKQLEEKLQQLSSKLSSMGSSVVLSVSSPSSLARSLHAAAQSAVQLANTARALADKKRPAQCKLIEDAAHEMCLSTYSLLKTSELVCQEPNHHDAKRKLLEACRHLNDSINKLVRSTATGKKTAVGRACGEAGRSLALHRGMLQAAPRPPLASSYALSVHTMQSQRDVLNKLNSDEAMSREEFLKSMNYAVTAVNNSAECAAQAAYLISVSDQDKSIGLKGPVDVGKLQKAIQAVEETCISIITTNDDIQLVEEQKALNGHIKDLKDAMKDAVEKTKEGELQAMLKECTNELLNSHLRLDQAIEANFGDKEVITSKVADLMHDVSNVACLAEHPDLVPVATDISADTQKHVDEIVKNSLTLLSNTEDLVKQVKAAPEEPETMKWVMFNKRKDVLDAFENLLKSVRASGERVNLLEAAVEEPEEEKKSYVETQFDLASKWLSKPMCKPEVKAKGQEAVRNLVEVANKVAEDLQGSDKEDMRNLIVETEQLLKDCSQKYDHEQYSVLLERVRELKKGVSRGVVSKLVQDFMQAEEPLADLDLIAEYEQDESKRKFMLEKKIAELLAQLGRVTGTARLVAHTHAHRAHDINQCSQQTELLAPMLVKAAQERIARPDDKAVIENYKSLLAKYAESMSKIRDLCDQSVDPMEFVQTAGETIERMREESSTHNDPLHNAHTSTAISKLANRVIHVGMSSSTARRDPELQRALAEAQHQLAAATPAPDTRASRMPDFKDTTARILQATEEVESLLCGETIFKQQPTQDQPIFNEAMNLHVAIRDWSSRDNEIVAVAKRMAVLMAKLSNFMNNDKQREVLATSKSIVSESHEVARLAKKLAHECTDHRIKTNLLQTCERIPTISGQLKMLTTVKGFSLGRHGTEEDKEAMDMLVGNAQSLMLSIQDVVKGAASASVKIMSQRGPRMKWVRKTVY
ncbi:talin-2 isoform X45 [Spodoptera frugiperda]|uniref:Talin-2 isoform X44 n=1 Tax=Spodoptera frugiperda TaxID=7108 RepID=A0A9R0EY00_SPOFR|nr:talin-2 isoform X44 [Spodoptera frugiperda]XP_050555304.1 talin-2 isoform X45 [Spodoptera frugiperda]